MHRFLSGEISRRRGWLVDLPPVTDSDTTTNFAGGGEDEDDDDGDEIIKFYTNQSSDHRNRTLSSLLSSTNWELECSHDYIQTLFPLPEPSPYNPLAPTIDQPTAVAFRSSSALRLALRSSLLRMLSFYGFDTAVNASGELVISRGNGWSSRSAFWRRRFNHNHLRITRIIRCLRVLGCEEDARKFYRAMSRSEGVGGRSLMYWRRALRRGLEVLPEDEDEDGVGDVGMSNDGDDEEEGGEKEKGEKGEKGEKEEKEEKGEEKV